MDDQLAVTVATYELSGWLHKLTNSASSAPESPDNRINNPDSRGNL